MVSVKPLTPERTFEEDEDCALLSDESDSAFSDGKPEDKDESGSHARSNEKEMFPRVTSTPDLVLRTSLLTILIHQNEHAPTPQKAASPSASANRRSRTPNYSIGSQPKTILQRFTQPSILASTNTDPPLLSPRSIRRHMLARELPEPLRKDILKEREVKRSTIKARLKRRHTINDINGDSYSNVFDADLQDCQPCVW